VLTADLFSPPRGFGGREARLLLSAPPPFQSVSFSSLLEMDVDAEDDEGDAAAHNWEDKDDQLPEAESDFPAAESSSDDELEETPVSPAGFAKVSRRVLRMNEPLWASHGAAEAGLSEEVLAVQLQRTELQDKLQRTETMMHTVAKTLFAKVCGANDEGGWQSEGRAARGSRAAARPESPA
jgi:hypothetical protein